MHYIQGSSRGQRVLFPESLEEYLSSENPVRFLDVFVNRLDLVSLGFRNSRLKRTGRPPYHPGVLLKLYLYGYLHGIRSSRRLESECHRNVELMWLLQKLSPDFKTISDFRKDNLSSLKSVCREFTVLCKDLDLFGKELVAIDGSKFKAVNSNQKNYSKDKLERLLKRIEGHISAYLRSLEESDDDEGDDHRPNAEELQDKIASLEDRKSSYEDLLMQLKESGDNQVSLNDADSRLMRDGHQGRDMCYNAQTAVDDKYHMIVADDVSNACNDKTQLAPLAIAAKDMLDVAELDVTADVGYHDSKSIKACVDTAITPYVPQPAPGNKLFPKTSFQYDATTDSYSCPAGKKLSRRGARFRYGKQMHSYSTTACYKCTLKSKCTKVKKGTRYIWRWEHEDLLEQMQQRMTEKPEMVDKRRCMAEHPFGTIKRAMGQDYFLLKGLKAVKAEFSLSVMAYNLKRAINVLGVPRLIEAVK